MVNTQDHKNIVYILGAGCSREDNVPLVNEFLDVSFKKVLPDLNMYDAKRFKNVKNFRNEVLPDSNVEELFSYIDFERIVKTYGNKYNLNNLRKDLLYVIAKTIEKVIRKGGSTIYENFWENHIVKSKSYHAITIITFNWDLLLDNILLSSPSFFIDGIPENYYGTSFSYMGDGRESYNRVPNSSLKLLKLHGSLNWLFCKNCKENNKFFVIGKKPAVKVLEGFGMKCPNCGNDLDTLIVPPTFQKIEEGGIISALSDIWKCAKDNLSNANRIVIAGYSFPEDDVHFRLFFRSALVENYKKKGMPIKIDILNHKVYQKEKNEFENHYKKIFNIPNVEIEPRFLYHKFSDFANVK